MFKPVEKKVNFPVLEERILKFWDQHEILRKTDKERAGCPEFVFYDENGVQLYSETKVAK